MNATWGEFDDDDRRSFRRVLLVSVAAHAVLLLLVAIGPRFSSTPAVPQAITVDLLAPPGPPPAAKAAPKPAKAKAPAREPAAPIPPPPAAKAEPVPPPPTPKANPAPPPPPTEAKLLPKEAAKAPEAVKPPPAVAKVAPAPPQAAPAKPAPPPARQASIDDVLAQMRADAGEAAPEPVEEAALQESDLAGTGGGGGSVQVSPEVMAWLKSARIHVRRSWVLAPGFRLEPLAAQVRVNLDATGNVVGEPAIVKRSGNPWYDESVLRAIQKASPLPAPPRAGEWDFLFQPEES